MEYLLLAVIALGVPFILPIALWVALYRTRTRLALLEQALEEHKDTVGRLWTQLAAMRAEGRAPADAMKAPMADAPASAGQAEGAIAQPVAPPRPVPASPPELPGRSTSILLIAGAFGVVGIPASSKVPPLKYTGS